MRIEKKLYQEPHHNWARVSFISDDQKKKTTVLVYVSEDYLDDNKILKNEKDEWFQGVMKKWEGLGDKIFEKEVYCDVYANDNNGEVNGLKFLKNEIRL